MGPKDHWKRSLEPFLVVETVQVSREGHRRISRSNRYRTGMLKDLLSGTDKTDTFTK